MPRRVTLLACALASCAALLLGGCGLLGPAAGGLDVTPCPPDAATPQPCSLPGAGTQNTLQAPVLEIPAGPDLPPAALAVTQSPGPSGTLPRPLYRLWLDLDYNAHQASVQQLISYTNPSAGPLSELLLVVEPARFPDALSIDQLALGPGQVPLPPNAYSLENNQLRLTLPARLAPGQTQLIWFNYRLTLPLIPEIGPTQPFGYTDRQLNLYEWYAFVPPLRTDGWQANPPGEFAEHLVYPAADFEVQVNLLDPPAGLQLAASALPEPTLDGGMLYRLPSARSFALSASPEYQVYTQTLNLRNQTVRLASYTMPELPAAGVAALQHTSQALEVYTELFGPYPHASLSVVIADFPDGMETSGLYFLSRSFYEDFDGTTHGYLATIAVHETAHQWWFSQVGNDQANEPWLDEALSTYAEWLYYEYRYPAEMAWWREFRIYGYTSSDPVGSAIYDFPTFRTYRDAVYLRGARYLHAVRARLGDRAFFAALQAYTAGQAGRVSAGEDFFAALAAADPSAVADLQALRAEFFSTR